MLRRWIFGSNMKLSVILIVFFLGLKTQALPLHRHPTWAPFLGEAWAARLPTCPPFHRQDQRGTILPIKPKALVSHLAFGLDLLLFLFIVMVFQCWFFYFTLIIISFSMLIWVYLNLWSPCFLMLVQFYLYL